MRLLSQIPPGSALPVYKSLRDLLRGNDKIIFESMVSVTTGQKKPFAPPSDSSEYEQKHVEIEARLKTADIRKQLSMPLRLMGEIWLRTKGAADKLPGDVVEGVRNVIRFEATGKDASIGISQDLKWEASWSIKHRILEHGEKISLEIYNSDLKEIVPEYIVEYASSAIHAYRQNMNATAAALLTIAVEATLRDVLIKRGYSFTHGALSVDSFKYTEADISASGNSYVLTFREPRLKPPSDLHVSSGGSPSVEIRIRRYINEKKDGRVDLYVLAPEFLIEHWSVGDVDKSANPRNVGGLGKALNIAREVEKFLLPTRLPLDLDDVILKVRNNLIHLSEETLSKQIIEDDEGNQMTLQHFLDDPWTMFSFITNVLRFINDTYVELKT
jgi:hypothetical protein